MMRFPVLLPLLLTMSLPALAAPRDYQFTAFLDGREIGGHSFRFQSLGNSPSHYRVTSEAVYKVRILFVTVYEYSHRSVEEWRDGCLVSIESSTDDNGENYAVTGRRTENGYRLDVNNETESVAEDCLRTFAYWNPRLLQTDRLLNSQTGQVEKVEPSGTGETDLPWAAGRPAETLELNTADGTIRLWYGGDRRWLGLRSELENGRTLEYRSPPGDSVAAGNSKAGERRGEWNL